MTTGPVMDTRTPSPSNSSADGVDAYKPDLSKEVAMLSTKLINAINYQTNLDDSLQASRHELEQAQQDLKKVRAEKQSLDAAIAQGVWVKKGEMDATIALLQAEIAQEREKRESAEKAKRQTDGELENLTSSLFEEANKMVAEARRDTDAVERRNSQLRGRLTDTETLLASQQEQLQDLKQTMEALERSATNTRDTSVPSTPVNLTSTPFEALQNSPGGADLADVSPNQPLHYSQLLQPVLRQDVAAYTEFAELLSSARKGAPHSRNASGTMTSSGSSTNLTSTATANATTNSTAPTSSPSLPGAFSFSSSASNSPNAVPYNPALKDSKFYKRILTEDLDPTLRLDLAPGLSFLSRRSVQSSLLAGTLIVEPFAPSSNWKIYAPVFPCALCGEARKDDKYMRRYRFRTSESEEAQRYPLCDFCLGRVRASGDFVSFLRMVREGFWRLGNEEEEKAAWEEAVRLRERMFWARVGGGVVPAGASSGAKASPEKAKEVGPRQSLDSLPDSRSRRSTAKADVDGERSSGEGGGVDLSGDRSRDDVTAAEPTTTDETATLEAQAKELKRRTMLHMGESVSLPGAQLGRTSTEYSSRSENQSQDEEAQASEQLQQEAESAAPRPASLSRTTSSDNELESMVSAEENPMPPPPVPPHREGVASPTTQEDQRPSSRSKERSDSQTSNSSQSALAPPRPEARRGSSASSVLARVRAMEAKNQ